jgi:hypothetical protein
MLQELVLVSQRLAWRNLNATLVVKSIDGRHHWEDINEKSVEEDLIFSVHFVPVEPS